MQISLLFSTTFTIKKYYIQLKINNFDANVFYNNITEIRQLSQ